jgi:hypothetical protein
MSISGLIGLVGFASVLAASAAMTSTFANGGGGAPNRDARITGVDTSGAPNGYTFNVTIASNDTGMDHYADWWEVVDADGKLVYRRVLLHDHADEQPFTRDGGPVPIARDAVVTVRAHVYPSGYANAAMRGSVAGGFKPVELPNGFAANLEHKPPQPDRM